MKAATIAYILDDLDLALTCEKGHLDKVRDDLDKTYPVGYGISDLADEDRYMLESATKRFEKVKSAYNDFVNTDFKIGD